jgi:hypothetical protein
MQLEPTDAEFSDKQFGIAVCGLLPLKKKE